MTFDPDNGASGFEDNSTPKQQNQKLRINLAGDIIGQANRSSHNSKTRKSLTTKQINTKKTALEGKRKSHMVTQINYILTEEESLILEGE